MIISLNDIADAVAKLVGAAGVLIAGLGLRNTARVRQEDLRWRKATAAHDILDEIHDHPFASEAVTIIDCHLGGHTYDAPEKMAHCEGLTLDRAFEALRASGGGEPWARYVYRCFDWFFYYLDRIGYHRNKGFLETEDVAGPLAPYATLLSSNLEQIEQLLDEHHYSHVRGLLGAVHDANRSASSLSTA